MGTWSGHKAKFVRRFANLKEVRDHGVHSYREAVKEIKFPDSEAESYSMDKTEWARFIAEISEGVNVLGSPDVSKSHSCNEDK